MTSWTVKSKHNRLSFTNISIFPLCFNLNFLFQGGSGLVGDDDSFGSGGAISSRIESSYIVNLRDMDMKHVKDFTFLHGEF